MEKDSEETLAAYLRWEAAITFELAQLKKACPTGPATPEQLTELKTLMYEAAGPNAVWRAMVDKFWEHHAQMGA